MKISKGKKYGHLTVIGHRMAENDDCKWVKLWTLECSCGTRIEGVKKKLQKYVFRQDCGCGVSEKEKKIEMKAAVKTSIRKRLENYAFLTQQSYTAVINDALDQYLPSGEELAELIAGGENEN